MGQVFPKSIKKPSFFIDNNIVSLQITMKKTFFMYMIQGISNIVRNLHPVLFLKAVSLLKETIDCKRGICLTQVLHNDRKRFFFNLHTKNRGILGCTSACIICASLIISCMFPSIICFSTTGIPILLQVFKKHFPKEPSPSEMHGSTFVLRSLKLMLLTLFSTSTPCLLFCPC